MPQKFLLITPRWFSFQKTPALNQLILPPSFLRLIPVVGLLCAASCWVLFIMTPLEVRICMKILQTSHFISISNLYNDPPKCRLIFMGFSATKTSHVKVARLFLTVHCCTYCQLSWRIQKQYFYKQKTCLLVFLAHKPFTVFFSLSSAPPESYGISWARGPV